MMRILELKVPPPAVALLIGIAMWFVARYGVVLDLPFAIRLTVFLAIAGIGGAIALAGDLAFKRAKTTLNPFRPQNTTALVTSGIYRYTRNPMYLGMTLVLLGWTAFLCSAWALPGAIAFVLYLNRFQIAPEERILSAKFGAAYAEYMAKTGRWL